MFVIQTEMPAAYQGRYDPKPLDADDLRKLGDQMLFVMYWYGAGSYEGAGHLLCSTDGMRWCDMDLGHCSCFGPIDGVPLTSTARTLDDLEAAYTEEAFRDVKPLFDAIRAHNWGAR